MNTTRHVSARNLAVLAVFCALFASCAVPAGTEATARVTIRVAEEGSAARGIVYNPAPPVGELAVTLDGDGPGSAGFSSIPVNGGTLELDLVAGQWAFTAKACNADGIAILEGSASARVDTAVTASVSITVRPPAGFGTITLLYTAPPEVPASALWRCALANASGILVQSWDDPIDAERRTLTGIPTGYYALSTRIMDGATPVSGATNVVRVLRDMSTTVPIAMAVKIAGAGIGIVCDPQIPLDTGITMLSRAAVRGFPLRLRASGPSDATYRWSCLGTIVAEGQIVDVPTTALPHAVALDLDVFGGLSAGAAALQLELQEPPRKAGWSLYATIGVATDSASQVLTRPAMLSASADGSVLGVASDGTSSRAELWRADPKSGELIPKSMAAIRIGGSARRATMLTVAPAGDHLAAANSESGWIWVAPADENGVLGTPSELVAGSAGLETMGYVRGLCFSPDASHLYALSNSDRAIYAFARSGESWTLAFRSPLDDFPCGTLSVLKSMAISPDGSALAVAAAGSDAVIMLAVGSTALSWKGQARLASGFTGLDYPQALAFSPDGAMLAVACKDTASVVLLDPAAIESTPSTLYNATSGFSGVPHALAFAGDGLAIGIGVADALVVLRLPSGSQPAAFGRFDATDSPALSSPLGLAFANAAFYTASPDGAALAIIGKPDL